jgi:methionine synthase II (cobalamin-independent)
MSHVATGVGSMPGESINEAMKTVFGELDDLPFVVELPARGPHAAMIGRTAAMITDIGIDLQPAGWRLTDASGLDHQRAVSLLAQDLDAVEELGQGRGGRFKTQVVGPWTLAASMERPRGDRVLGDHGARRDLAQALVEGARAHAADVRRRLPDADVIVQVDEPSLPAVLAGVLPTSSGLNRHRPVSRQEAAEALEWLAAGLSADGLEVVAHCCAADLPVAVFAETSVRALSFDLGAVSSDLNEGMAQWVDDGRSLWPGVVPASDPVGAAPTPTDITRRLISWWSDLGRQDVAALPDTVVTPACGLAGASPTWARTALETARTVARNLSVEAGKIEP